MSDKEIIFESWEEVIVSFFEENIENITSKPQKCLLYRCRKKIDEKLKKIKDEKESNKINKLTNDLILLKDNLIKQRKESPSTEIRTWLDLNTRKSGRVMKATHLLKFSHTSSDAEGVLLEEKSADVLLTTSSLKKLLSPDLAHNNGALISVSRFLYLSFEGKRIIDLILNNNFNFLIGFYQNRDQLNIWAEGLLKLVQKTKEIKTTDKAKQLYFPLDNSKKYENLKDIPYHLITPLFSSSLAEELDQFVNHLRHSEEQKNIKKYQMSKKDDSPKYHIRESMVVPNVGILNYGGEYPRNVSMLNANRQGKSFLFSTQPPSWKNQLKPPVYKKTLFDNLTNYQINEDIRYLRDFLLRFKHLDLSYRDPKRYVHLVRWVESIIDEVFYYANTIQKLPHSWSTDKNIQLDIEHQYFLDPYRNDDEFQAHRSTTDWQSVISNDFANWLNRKLAGKEKKFTPKAEHTRLWKKLFEPAIREDCEEIKAEREYSNKKETV